uniref:Uncharacterized protein n=1 Tax=Ursus maritimus TaxID=29073 RepID=A0A452TUR1_URSMA
LWGRPQASREPEPAPTLPACRLALYVYEYLLHVGAQKSAQTFLSEIRWEKNITLGEPPGFLHSWWCVFWDLYCAAPDRREACEHSNEAKAFQDYVSPWGPRPTLRMPSQHMSTLGSVTGLSPLPSAPTSGHPSMGPMQRVTPPRGMASVGPQVRAGPGEGRREWRATPPGPAVDVGGPSARRGP